MVSAHETRENGIKFEVGVVGDGTGDNPHRPAIFDSHAGFFHLESIDPAANSAVLWLDKSRSPEGTADDIRNEVDPLGTMLKETG